MSRAVPAKYGAQRYTSLPFGHCAVIVAFAPMRTPCRRSVLRYGCLPALLRMVRRGTV